MLTVEKIGGTSMSALQDVIDNIIYHDNQLINQVFVMSAFSGCNEFTAGK
jgi:aspartate kinase